MFLEATVIVEEKDDRRFEPHELVEMREHATFSGDHAGGGGLHRGGDSDRRAAPRNDGRQRLSKGPQRGRHPSVRAHDGGVADVYDVLTAKRVYKPAMAMHQALMLLHKECDNSHKPSVDAEELMEEIKNRGARTERRGR